MLGTGIPVEGQYADENACHGRSVRKEGKEEDDSKGSADGGASERPSRLQRELTAYGSRLRDLCGWPRRRRIGRQQMLRHILFMRGQLPMPYHELVQVLKEREGRDAAARQGIAAAAAAAAAATAAVGSSGAGHEREGEEAGGPSGRRFSSGSRDRSKGAKGGRPLAKAPAHRRARKCLGVLDETKLALDEAFADAARKGRPVLEALVLLGASHLSPREIYSVTFAQPPPAGISNGDVGGPPAGGDDDGPPAGGGGGDDRRQGGSGGGASVQGKSSLADAYSRKLVRSLVGAMSSVTFRRLGSCRAHLFLRVADAHPLSVAEDGGTAIGSGDGRCSTGMSPQNHATIAGSSTLPSASPHATINRVVARPGFKIRMLRSRPASKVSVVLSKRPPAPLSASHQSPQDGASGAGSAGHSRQQVPQTIAPGGDGGRPVPTLSAQHQGGRGFERHLQRTAAGEGNLGCDVLANGYIGQQQHQQHQQQERGVWCKLVCARLAGLKGCESLAC